MQVNGALTNAPESGAQQVMFKHKAFTKRLKAFILHAGEWGVNKRFCINHTASNVQT